jgi:hypothetical protein
MNGVFYTNLTFYLHEHECNILKKIKGTFSKNMIIMYTLMFKII